jgi:hypothetical protein
MKTFLFVAIVGAEIVIPSEEPANLRSLQFNAPTSYNSGVPVGVGTTQCTQAYPVCATTGECVIARCVAGLGNNGNAACATADGTLHTTWRAGGTTSGTGTTSINYALPGASAASSTGGLSMVNTGQASNYFNNYAMLNGGTCTASYDGSIPVTVTWGPSPSPSSSVGGNLDYPMGSPAYDYPHGPSNPIYTTGVCTDGINYWTHTFVSKADCPEGLWRDPIPFGSNPLSEQSNAMVAGCTAIFLAMLI